MNNKLNTFLAIVAIIIALAAAWPSPARSRPPLGVTNFDSVHLSDSGGTATPLFLGDQTGTGVIVELRDGATPVFQVNNGGLADFHGQQIDLDADNDTSITADTDDEIDFEIGGTDTYTMTASLVDFNGKVLDLDVDNDTSITVDTDDRIDFEVGGADELRITTTGPAIVEASVIALSAAGTITPTTAYQPITSTAAVTASATTAIADGTVVGQLLIIVNENASDAIIIPDAANTNLSGATTLGNDDTLWLIWDGADWLEIGQADN